MLIKKQLEFLRHKFPTIIDNESKKSTTLWRMLSISSPSQNAHSSACLAKREKVGFQLELAPTKAGKPEQMEGHLPYHLPKRYGTAPQEH